MSKTSPAWNNWDKLMTFLCLCIILYPITTSQLPQIEGRYFPVVSQVSLTHLERTPPPDYRNLWSGDAEKLRNCEYIQGSLSWYLGSFEARQQVDSQFLDKPEVRVVGTLHWSAIEISLDRDLVMTNSYALVRHQCPWRWWQTETLFYVSG